jgi:uncharacterized protein YbaA (DUF1428 family)
MGYVDAVVVPVQKKRLKEYIKIIGKMKKLWKEFGALSYVEALADDAKPGKSTSFPQSVKLKAGETVVVAFVTYKSRAHRDAVNKKMHTDPRVKAIFNEGVPFDMRRVFFGGFKVLVS